MIVIDNKSNIRSFGRIKARNITENDERLMNEFLPKVEIKLNDDFDKVFNNNNKIHFEIGFGFGESILQRAIKNPDINYIGCEAYIKGVANLLSGIENNNVKNLRVFHGDARLLLESIKNNSIDKVFVLFPDPWPKKKQNKRRIINEEFLDLLYDKLKSGGELFFASDILNYVEWTIEKVENTKKFNKKFNNLDNCKVEPSWWIKTKYQTKAIKEGRESYFLEWGVEK